MSNVGQGRFGPLSFLVIGVEAAGAFSNNEPLLSEQAGNERNGAKPTKGEHRTVGACLRGPGPRN